jgi:hypothetical protein
VDGMRLGYNMATSTVVTVNTREPLRPGQKVTARWTLGGETSPLSPVPQTVLGYPTSLGPLTCWPPRQMRTKAAGSVGMISGV